MKYTVSNLMSANIVLTSNCNSRCLSCDYWRKKPDYLDKTMVYKFLAELQRYNCESIVFTGGEPFLHPDFEEIVRTAKLQYGYINILSTNGRLIKKNINKVYDYIDSYCISFDGCNKEQYKKIRGIDNYNEILDVIKIIKNYNENIQVWLSCLIQKKNYINLIDIYRVALMSGADGIFFNVPELRDNCFGREGNTADREELLLDLHETEDFANIVEELLIMDETEGFLCQDKEALNKFIQYFKSYNGLDEFPERKCFVPYNTITLNEKGKIRPCFYLNDEAEMIDENINSDFMIGVRRRLWDDNNYKINCGKCCQFNS